MNTVITSKEAIMQACRKIAAQKGLSALNMRTVAKECNIALGTLYNYYADKDELLIAAVESVWKDIFHMDGKCETSLSFPDYVDYIFGCIQRGAAEYPGFLSGHSVAIAKSKKGEAKSTMEHYFEHIKSAMLNALRTDTAVNPTAFNEAFTESCFIDFVTDSILLLIIKREPDCSVLTEIIRRTIYR